MTQEQIDYFRTFGFFLGKQLLSPDEMTAIANAFNAAMERARGGAPKPQPGEKRQQVVPFFDYDPDVFYPLLDDDRILDNFEQLWRADEHYMHRSIVTAPQQIRDGFPPAGSFVSRFLTPDRQLPISGPSLAGAPPSWHTLRPIKPVTFIRPSPHFQETQTC